MSGHGRGIFKKKLGKLITHTHDEISRLWQAWVCSALTRYRTIATQRWLKTFLQYSHIQKNYYEIKQINISNKRYFNFALKLLNVLNWGLQYLSKHYSCISQCSGIRLVCHCSASASCSVFSWCSAVPWCAHSVSGCSRAPYLNDYPILKICYIMCSRLKEKTYPILVSSHYDDLYDTMLLLFPPK